MDDGRAPRGLAALERDLRRDPVLVGLVDELVRRDAAERGRRPRRRPRAVSHRVPALVAGLALMLAGCLALSTAIAVVGMAVALAGLVPARRPPGRGGGPSG